MSHYRAIIRLLLTLLMTICSFMSLTAFTAVAAVDEITSLPFVSQGVIPFPDRNGPFRPIKWNLEQFPGGRVPFELNPNGPAGVAVSLPERELIIEAIRAAFQTWEDVATARIAFDLQIPSSPPAIGRLDGVSVVSFADPGDDLDPATVAATSIYALVNSGRATVGPIETVVDFPGEIIEADLVFNPRVPFATDGNLSAFDIQGVATHELGHAIGRDHTAILTATMFTVAERGNLRERQLTSDDIGGLSAVYPDEPSFSEGFGSISGVARSSGSPVLGAHVVAVNADGVPVVSALTFPDGTYTVVGLPPGQYKVYAEPTDGPVEADSYDLGVLFPFSPAFNTALRTGLVTVEAGVSSENVDFSVISPAPLNLTGITPFDPNIFLPVAPVGLLVERGSTLEAELVGSGLRQGTTISFDGPGIGNAEVIDFLGPNPFARFSGDSSVDFRVSIGADAPLGPRNVVVRSAQGLAILPGAITIVEQGSLPPPTSSLPTSARGTISSGQTVTGNIASPGQRDSWTFTGSAGDVATIAMNASAGSFLDTFLELLSPDGRQLTINDDSGGTLNSLISSFVLPADGAYTIVARGFQTSTGGYNLTLRLTPAGALPPAGGGTITPGQTVTGNIASPGQRDSWTFTGSAGDIATISMNASAGSFLDTFLELNGPDGRQLTLDDDGGPGLNSLISNFPLPVTGTYTIVARGFQTSTGGYSLTLQLTPAGALPPAGGGTITPGQTVTGNIASPGQRDNWTFNGSAGDVVTISMNASAGGLLDTFLELNGPDSAQLTLDDDSGPGLNSLIGNFPLPVTGTYTIVARGFQTSTGGYNLTLQLTPAGALPPAGGGTITPGQTATGSISTPGERDSWTFQGRSGDRVTIRMNATAVSALDTFLELIDPNGVVIAQDDDSGPALNSLISDLILPLDGTYTIIARGFFTSTGDYNLLVDLVRAGPTAPGGAGLNPRLFFTLDSASLRVGQTLNLDLNLIAGSQNPPVDLYIGAMLPDGTFLFMTQNLFNPFVSDFTLFLREFTVQDTTLNIVSGILPEGSQGRYVVIAAFVVAGSPVEIFNLIDIDRVEFVIE